MNNQTTLTFEIKKTLRNTDYPMLFFGSFVISVLGLLMVMGYHPNLILSPFSSFIGFIMSMTVVLCSVLLGIIIGITIAKHYEPKVKQYVDAPKEIEAIRDALISLGAFVTTIDNAVNAKQIAKVFRNISKQLSKIKPLENEVTVLKKEMIEMKTTYMNEFQKARQEYWNEKSAKIKAESETRKITLTLNDVLTENFRLKEENKKLKGE